DRRVKRVWLDTKWRDHVADARSHLVTDGIGRAREIWYARERHIRAEMYLQWLTNADQIELCQKIVAKAQRTIDRAGDPRGKDSIRSGSLTGALDDGERAAAGQR